MPPKKPQLKHNASSKGTKAIKRASAKAKPADNPLMVFEFDSGDEEMSVTPLRPRGAVPTPKLASGQSSDGNDLSDHFTDHPSQSDDGDEGGGDTTEDGSDELEDVLAGLVEDPSPAALNPKRAVVRPRRGGTTRGGNKRVKCSATDAATLVTDGTPPPESDSPTKISGVVASDAPVFPDPLGEEGLTPPKRAHPASKRGRKAMTAPSVVATSPHSAPQLGGEVKRKRGRPPKNTPTTPKRGQPPKNTPTTPKRGQPPKNTPTTPKPLPSLPPSLQPLPPLSSSPTPLVAVEAAMIEGHPLSESPVQVEIHDSGVAQSNHTSPPPPPLSTVAPEQQEVMKRKRGRPRKRPLTPPPPPPPPPPQPVHGGAHEPPTPAAQGVPSEWAESPLLRASTDNNSLVRDTLTGGTPLVNTSTENTPIDDTPTKGTPTVQDRPGTELTPLSGAEVTPLPGVSTNARSASGSCEGTSVMSDVEEIAGDGTHERLSSPTKNGTGHLKMETDSVVSSNVPGSNVRWCARDVQHPPGDKEGEGDTTEEEMKEGEGDTTEEEVDERVDEVTKSVDVPVPSITRSSTWPSRGATHVEKGLQTVVRNVKQAHECQLLGESQQHIDELYFLLDSTGPDQSPSMRALATCSLAHQCLGSEFRQVIKEKKLLSKMFARLKDGTGDPGIRLAIVVLAYVLSQDKSNHDWNHEVADLLVLVMSLERKEVNGEEVVAAGKDSKDYLRILSKARKVVESTCADMMDTVMEAKNEGLKAEKPGDLYKINVQDICIPELVCEVFLTIGAPHNNCQWLREQLRASGGLDLIANMVISGCNFVEQSLKGKDVIGQGEATLLKRRLKETERQLKCLENATFMNKANQSYLVVFDGSLLVSKLTKLLLGCLAMIDKTELRHSSQECLVSVTKVLLNLTHDNELGSCRLGEQGGLLRAVLEIVFKLPDLVPEGEQFDILVLGLGLLINLTELSAPNRQQLQTLPLSHAPFDVTTPTRGYPLLGPLAHLFLRHHSKVEQATIDVPTPQRLSQLTSQDSPSSSKCAPSQGSGQPATTTFSERLKQLKMAKKSPKVEARDQGTDLDGSLAEKVEEEDGESSVQIDPLVFSREDFDNALNQAGRHMEDSILAAYAALLLGILAKHHHDCVDHVRNEMPSKSFAEMLGDLNRFVSFMNMTGAPAGLDSVRRIIKYLEVV